MGAPSTLTGKGWVVVIGGASNLGKLKLFMACQCLFYFVLGFFGIFSEKCLDF